MQSLPIKTQDWKLFLEPIKGDNLRLIDETGQCSWKYPKLRLRHTGLSQASSSSPFSYEVQSNCQRVEWIPGRAWNIGINSHIFQTPSAVSSMDQPCWFQLLVFSWIHFEVGSTAWLFWEPAGLPQHHYRSGHPLQKGPWQPQRSQDVPTIWQGEVKVKEKASSNELGFISFQHQSVSMPIDVGGWNYNCYIPWWPIYSGYKTHE